MILNGLSKLKQILFRSLTPWMKCLRWYLQHLKEQLWHILWLGKLTFLLKFSKSQNPLNIWPNIAVFSSEKGECDCRSHKLRMQKQNLLHLIHFFILSKTKKDRETDKIPKQNNDNNKSHICFEDLEKTRKQCKFCYYTNIMVLKLLR